ncbi:putative selenate ABC transporter substrate-binding protein [Kineococcus gypseus]|uniref:putative selenate ABC transporter substrate-binding protein n=1 Tax=Kineococcus gypseus TaxID=1637102 RepID=UPI003D7DD49A
MAAGLLPLLAGAAGCSGEDAAGGSAPVLALSSIPDQDQATLAARDGAMAEHLSAALGVRVEVVPVTDYTASVGLFRSGDLDLVFFGGLTGVQARLQAPGSALIAQRDIDSAFTSVFVAGTGTGIAPFGDVEGLAAFAGRRFTFGSETSTSGRLMPAYFLERAGVGPDAFAGEPGFSGSHDKTLDLVESGTFEGGALNSQVWRSRVAAGTVDTGAVRVVFETPPYHDYHYLAGPGTDERFGAGFTDRLREAITSLSAADPQQADVLERFGAGAFVPARAQDYERIEEIGRDLGLVV